MTKIRVTVSRRLGPNLEGVAGLLLPGCDPLIRIGRFPWGF